MKRKLTLSKTITRRTNSQPRTYVIQSMHTIVTSLKLLGSRTKIGERKGPSFYQVNLLNNTP